MGRVEGVEFTLRREADVRVVTVDSVAENAVNPTPVKDADCSSMSEESEWRDEKNGSYQDQL